MTAPTEQEIRQAVEVELGDQTINSDDLLGLVDALRPIMDSDMARVRAGWDDEFYPKDDHPGTLWADMTHDEVDELHGAIQDVIHRVAREATVAVVDGCVAAAVAFAGAHPDVPRGRWTARREEVPA